MVAELPVAEKRVKKTSPLPIATKLKAKNLYLYQDASHQRIAKETGLSVDASESLAVREGWVEQRRARAKKLEEKSDARSEQADLAIVEAIGSQAEEIALSGLDRARDAVKRKGKDAAKNFQSWTGGIRNLVSAIKTIRAHDGGSLGNSESPTLNFFFVRASDQAPQTAQPDAKTEDCKIVTEAVVTKQVTE